MSGVTGIHHVTAIAGDARENLRFYTELLGMRLVKRSVNQDDPGTYHLFYADAVGHPGTDLTFFPWAHSNPGRDGVGLTTEVALAVPAGSLDFWSGRLAEGGVVTGERSERFGEACLPLTDPHGLPLVLVETDDDREFAPWQEGPVPEEMQVRRIHGVRLLERHLDVTGDFLRELFGYREAGEEDGWHRFEVAEGGSSRILDIRTDADAPRGRWGRGSVHHVAFRVPDEEAQLALRAEVEQARLNPTPVIDRFWFKSVYFLEPGGVLFEIATDGPGFAVDEDKERLGERLVLPPWLEPQREAIEAALPVLSEV